MMTLAWRDKTSCLPETKIETAATADSPDPSEAALVFVAIVLALILGGRTA